jgi:hypothetical protein
VDGGFPNRDDEEKKFLSGQDCGKYVQSAQKCGSKFFDWSRKMTLFYRDLFYAWQRRYLN